MAGRTLRVSRYLFGGQRAAALLVGAVWMLSFVAVAVADDTSPSCLTQPTQPIEDKDFCATTRHYFGWTITRLGWQGSMGNNPHGEYWKLRKIEVWRLNAMGNPERVQPICCGAEAQQHTNQTWPSPGFTYAYDNLSIETSGNEVVAYYCGVFHESAYFDFVMWRWVDAHDTDLKWDTDLPTNAGSPDYEREWC